MFYRGEGTQIRIFHSWNFSVWLTSDFSTYTCILSQYLTEPTALVSASVLFYSGSQARKYRAASTLFHFIYHINLITLLTLKWLSHLSPGLGEIGGKFLIIRGSFSPSKETVQASSSIHKNKSGVEVSQVQNALWTSASVYFLYIYVHGSWDVLFPLQKKWLLLLPLHHRNCDSVWYISFLKFHPIEKISLSEDK